MSTQPIPRYTPEQYLAMERAAETRHEYFGGEISASPVTNGCCTTPRGSTPS